MRTCLLLILGVVMAVCASPALLQAKDTSGEALRMGGITIRVISLIKNDLQASILKPATEAQQRDIATAYPQGLIHNSLNILLLRGNGVVALVDTGYARTVPELRAALQEAGVTPEDVTHVILTHAHGDHIGGLLQDGKPVFSRAAILFSQQELAHWTDPALQAETPENVRGMIASVGAVVRAYGERVSSFTPGTDICAGLPGVQAVDESGHTPGHVGIMARADGKTFLFWSDLLHAFGVQSVWPSVFSSYDMDPEAAARIRAQLLQQARAEGWLVTGSHVPFVQPQPLQ